VLNLALTRDLGVGWHAGFRAALYSGIPQYDYNTLLSGQTPARTDAVYRLDVRIEKRWHLGERGYLSLVGEGFNVTLQKEVTGVSCSVAGCVYVKSGPITIPSIGVEAGW
jgi:hypothetical protein